ncbi:uncharacterized protein LOC126910315 isoform X2 [Daktulosphaira vitifoliae]|nr:uncharacterized protein LOC126910315 isoform X2 [Daktulosphaira vitifoliae]
MVSTKVIFALTIVAVASVQVNGKPAESQAELFNQLEKSFKDITSKIKEAVNSDNVDQVKKKLNTYADELNNNYKSLTKSFENSEFGKQANKQWASAMEIYNRNVPSDLTSQKINERLESAWKSASE